MSSRTGSSYRKIEVGLFGQLRQAQFAREGVFEDALEKIQRAHQLVPNDVWVILQLTMILVVVGRPQEGETRMREAIRLNPHFPNFYSTMLAFALEQSGKTDEVINVLRQSELWLAL